MCRIWVVHHIEIILAMSSLYIIIVETSVAMIHCIMYFMMLKNILKYAKTHHKWIWKNQVSRQLKSALTLLVKCFSGSSGFFV